MNWRLFLNLKLVLLLIDNGKLITWGSTDDLGQSYVTSGKHGVCLSALLIFCISWIMVVKCFFINILYWFCF